MSAASQALYPQIYTPKLKSIEYIQSTVMQSRAEPSKTRQDEMKQCSKQYSTHYKFSC